MILTTRHVTFAFLLAAWVFECLVGFANGVVPDGGDREFLKQALAGSDAESKIAALASRNAGKEECMALALRLLKYHAGLSAALREYARLRRIPIKADRFSQFDPLVQSFQRKQGRTYDDAFRDLLARDPVGLIPLYGAGAADVGDRVLRALFERVYGELKAQRPRAARAHLRAKITAAHREERSTARGGKSRISPAEPNTRKGPGASGKRKTRREVSSGKRAPAESRSDTRRKHPALKDR